MVKNNLDTSLFFLTLSLGCVWLILDSAVGKNRLKAFLASLFPFMDSDTVTKSTGSNHSGTF